MTKDIGPRERRLQEMREAKRARADAEMAAAVRQLRPAAGAVVVAKRRKPAKKKPAKR